MKFYRLTAAAIVAAGSLWAGSTAQAIVAEHADISDDGLSLTGDDPFHVEMGEDYKAVGTLELDFSGSPFAFCSTTLIGAEWALTAAHCVDFPSEFNVNFNGGRIAADAWYVPDSWSSDLFAGNDIALVHLSEPVPSSVLTPEPLFREGNEILQQGEYVGYGLAGNGFFGGFWSDNFRRKGENIVDGTHFDWLDLGLFTFGHPNLLISDFDVMPDDITWPFFSSPVDDPEKDYPLLQEVGVAPGDSGGPLFINGKVAGVASFLFAGWDFIPDGSFTDYFGHTSVKKWADWIDGVMAFHEGTGPDPGTSVGTPGASIISAVHAQRQATVQMLRLNRQLGIPVMGDTFADLGNRGLFAMNIPDAAFGATPEPATAGLVLVGSLVLLGRRRRHA